MLLSVYKTFAFYWAPHQGFEKRKFLIFDFVCLKKINSKLQITDLRGTLEL